MQTTAIGILIPFIGTTLGAAMVFFMKNEMSIRLTRVLLGFASGVMLAASVWSLLLPSIEQAEAAGHIDRLSRRYRLPAFAGYDYPAFTS